MVSGNVNRTALHPSGVKPQVEHTELEEELHTKAHLDYDRVAIVCTTARHLDFSPTDPFPHQIANPGVAVLYEDALVYETGSAITASGALSAYSGAKTGRSPSDKRIVKEASSEKDIWWGPVNKPMSEEVRSLCLHVLSIDFTKPAHFGPSNGDLASKRKAAENLRKNALPRLDGL